MICFSAFNLQAQKTNIEDDKAKAATQANNPLADMTALNIHNYYVSKLSDAPAASYLNTTWIRFAKPLADGKLLLRVSAPLSSIGSPDTVGLVNTISGLGDVNAFISYNFISNAKTTMGIGPLVAAPTATQSEIGVGQWQTGLAFVTFFAQSPQIQFGSLITWQTSVGGKENDKRAQIAAFQPFYIWQLGKGTYLRGAPIWVFDIENDAYHLPIGLGIGKVIKVEHTVFNLFIEPQYSMLTAGSQPQFQLFSGINIQFMKN
ncbi:hypothetical protein PEDI_51090 [Persicobacter diffluens]|uniref:Neuromedin U n=2 Tax=Persicobacter diffluens TaxID=981 RepID=A0AAN5AN85_9BACT|nr:hypothetical protein PEDI_51090 [Persicobacter diffluens]